MSLPSWERGLKPPTQSRLGKYLQVAPLVGAWIETLNELIGKIPHLWSLPSWERGLKQYEIGKTYKTDKVAPLVGAWIETLFLLLLLALLRRSPRGSVD